MIDTDQLDALQTEALDDIAAVAASLRPGGHNEEALKNLSARAQVALSILAIQPPMLNPFGGLMLPTEEEGGAAA